jgi:hypothetical protein
MHTVMLLLFTEPSAEVQRHGRLYEQDYLRCCLIQARGEIHYGQQTCLMVGTWCHRPQPSYQHSQLHQLCDTFMRRYLVLQLQLMPGQLLEGSIQKEGKCFETWNCAAHAVARPAAPIPPLPCRTTASSAPSRSPAPGAPTLVTHGMGPHAATRHPGAGSKQLTRLPSSSMASTPRLTPTRSS